MSDNLHRYKLVEMWPGLVRGAMPDVEPIVFLAADLAEAKRTGALLGYVTGRWFQLRDAIDVEVS